MPDKYLKLLMRLPPLTFIIASHKSAWRLPLVGPNTENGIILFMPTFMSRGITTCVRR